MTENELKNILKEFPECITNGSKFKGVVKDLYPNTEKSVMNTLAIMMDLGIVKEFKFTSNITDLDIRRWKKKLEELYGLSEKIILSCFNILGISVGLNQIKQKVSENRYREINVRLDDFEIENAVLYKYKGAAVNVEIPNGVTRIAGPAFAMCETLESIIIPNSVTLIDDLAFSNCKNLKNVTLGNAVKIIGDWTFVDCESLEKIIIPDSIDSIGKYAFQRCTNLTQLTIGRGVKDIGDSAFDECKSLEGVTIPKSVRTIGESAFSHCVKLGSVIIEEGVKYIGESAFDCCESLKNVIIPESVLEIADSAFWGCKSLISVKIENASIEIGYNVFDFCDSLCVIHYFGTKRQWKAITKGEAWVEDIDEIHCFDGVFKY